MGGQVRTAAVSVVVAAAVETNIATIRSLLQKGINPKLLDQINAALGKPLET